MKKPANYTVHKIRPAGETRQAVGGFEAAAILGLHFTVPYRLAKTGKLTAHTHDVGDKGRQITFFDGAECEENWCGYSEKMALEGGTGKRPRTNDKHRKAVLKHLAAVEHKIQLSDAISVAEAAEIMGTHVTWANRLVKEGKLIGRRLWSPRSSKQPQWIVSKKSALANLADAKAAFSTGKMQGRVRYSLKKKT
jgi:hypothetical protein